MPSGVFSSNVWDSYCCTISAGGIAQNSKATRAAKAKVIGEFPNHSILLQESRINNHLHTTRHDSNALQSIFWIALFLVVSMPEWLPEIKRYRSLATQHGPTLFAVLHGGRFLQSKFTKKPAGIPLRGSRGVPGRTTGTAMRLQRSQQSLAVTGGTDNRLRSERFGLDSHSPGFSMTFWLTASDWLLLTGMGVFALAWWLAFRMIR